MTANDSDAGLPVQLDLFAVPTRSTDSFFGPSPARWRGLRVWHAEIDRLLARERAASSHYRRFDETARSLNPERIRESRDSPAIALLERRLRAARHPGLHLHGLDRVWTRAELGVLLTETVNRGRQLAIGRLSPRPRGPCLDPSRIPSDRLDVLIQTHRDLDLVARLRAERRRREGPVGPQPT